MEMAILALAVMLFALLWFAGPAFAGADTTFDTALTKFTDFLEGSGGKVITVLSLAGAFDLGHDLPRTGGVAGIVDDDPVAIGRQAQGDGAADAPGGARDDGGRRRR